MRARIGNNILNVCDEKRRGRGTVLVLLLMLATVLLPACSTPGTVSYSPSSTRTIQGSIAVAEFTYLPADTSRKNAVLPNQIRNSAAGRTLIDKNVSSYVRDAVFAELRFVGINTAGSGKTLEGSIEEFYIDDLGLNVDWSLRITYSIISKASGAVIYKSTKTSSKHTSKFTASPFTFSEVIKENIDQLLGDPAFSAAVI